MRLLVVPIAAFALMGASDENSPEIVAPSNPEQIDLLQDIANPNAECIDQMHEIETQEAQVRIDPRRRFLEPAEPRGNEFLIWAVDRRENGCGVMVMMGDPDDVRQVPKPIGPARPMEIERK